MADLIAQLRLCGEKKLIVSYKPMVRVGPVCRKAVREIEQLRTALSECVERLEDSLENNGMVQEDIVETLAPYRALLPSEGNGDV
jgi:hypothetical protein